MEKLVVRTGIRMRNEGSDAYEERITLAWRSHLLEQWGKSPEMVDKRTSKNLNRVHNERLVVYAIDLNHGQVGMTVDLESEVGVARDADKTEPVARMCVSG
jgi:hypothetical protein